VGLLSAFGAHINQQTNKEAEMPKPQVNAEIWNSTPNTLTDQQIADHCTRQKMPDLKAFLKNNNVELNDGKESKGSLILKAINVSVRLRDEAKKGKKVKAKNKSESLNMHDLISQARSNKAEKKEAKSKRGPSGPSRSHVNWAHLVKELLDAKDGISMQDLFSKTIDAKKGKSQITFGSRMTNLRIALSVFGLGKLTTTNGLMHLELKDWAHSAFMDASKEALEEFNNQLTSLEENNG
jgi:hypothetical protein